MLSVNLFTGRSNISIYFVLHDRVCVFVFCLSVLTAECLPFSFYGVSCLLFISAFSVFIEKFVPLSSQHIVSLFKYEQNFIQIFFI